MGLLQKLRDLVDPAGPLGEVLSPADVYKERAGLPVTSPHTARVLARAPAHLEATLAPPRFVALADATDVPADRVRALTADVEEHWNPVYAKTTSTDMVEILRASQTLVGWTVVQRQTADSRLRARKYQSMEEFAEIAQRAQIQASDEFYNGIMETVPGNDPLIVDGEVLRASDGTIIRGTMITKGRKEYNTRTKGMAHWDVGFVKERMKAHDEMAARPIQNVRANLERTAGEVLPMRRILANRRYDRQSAV
jgi:hypothetical protein